MRPEDKETPIVVRKFASFEEAEEADEAWYASLTPQERLDITFQLVEDYFKLMNVPDPGFVRVVRKGSLEELKDG